LTKTYFNPGCALSIYKPETENKILKFLNKNCTEKYGEVELHKICCCHEPQIEEGSLIINVCAGCDRSFRSLYQGITTISLWEVIDELDSFKFPDYKGLQISVHDACPIREKPQVHKAVRSLLNKMNVEIVETEFHGTHSICCGDDLYPTLSLDKVNEKMRERAESMPCEDVCVYCVSCIKAMHIGGKTPRHLMDMLLGETTEAQIYDTEEWHKQLQKYIDIH